MKFYKTIFIALLLIAFIGCSKPVDENTPTGVLKKFVESSRKKDAEGIKQTLSSGTLKQLEESAKKQNLTVDEILRKEDGNISKEVPETRNEQITGDTATLEIKNGATTDWDKFPFIKEDGKWKIALDKFMSESLNKSKQ